MLGTFPHDPPIRAIIAGKESVFSTADEKFRALADECRGSFAAGSSTDHFLSDAYGQIVAMGWQAVPLLLQEVAAQSGHWITALTWITGIDLSTPATRGSARELRKAWLRWGIDNGYYSGNSQGEMVQEESAGNTGKPLRVHE